ncbi:MAG: hypothetical protein K2M34_01800 [Alphaproteobacteria bacterium]|nr:hypothetical protein [Alphaproteobacteria bacterium]
MKKAIPSIAQLEQELLAESAIADMELPDVIQQDAGRTLTATQVRHDVSAFARALINVYGGWPFLPDAARRQVLVALRRIQDNAHDNMTAGDLFDVLRPIIAQFADCHMCIMLDKQQARTNKRKPGRDVGKNIAGDDVVKLEMRGNVAVIAIRTLRDYETYFKPLQAQVADMLTRSAALVVDLRGNGGGSSRATDKLAYNLYGAHVPMAKKVYIRATPDAAVVHGRKHHPDWLTLNDGLGTALWVDAGDNLCPVFESAQPGYRHPIYVLTDWRTMSSAEMFCTKIKPHPYVKFVGDNTRGGEVYGDVGHIYLPTSKIKFIFGCVYRELVQENFETNGYAPDILCDDGQDAFDVAMQDFATRQISMVNLHNKGKV